MGRDRRNWAGSVARPLDAGGSLDARAGPGRRARRAGNDVATRGFVGADEAVGSSVCTDERVRPMVGSRSRRSRDPRWSRRRRRARRARPVFVGRRGRAACGPTRKAVGGRSSRSVGARRDVGVPVVGTPAARPPPDAPHGREGGCRRHDGARGRSACPARLSRSSPTGPSSRSRMGFDPADFAPPPPPLDLERFRIVHTGTMHTDVGRLPMGQRGRRRVLGGMPVPGVDFLTRSHVFLMQAIDRLLAADPGLADVRRTPSRRCRERGRQGGRAGSPRRRRARIRAT